ncbi:E3 ubiquitin-protein ligase ZSWIM2 isoform X1 [Ictalurus furcatus]|uniref:E3 ubiquitin-protein ligase ZSWIM2 isoform X1 n=1 Tax=Ictalurus furcatus TaxID=66913 RepID=UPI00234FFA3B|nr:E3 ubiquitin-protein ligase ZSWIM2 isoform X1 [Ictalurus furcatus]
MLRKRVWRKAANDAVSWHQDESLNTTIFILKEFGPTGFLLKEDREPKNYKVFLGDPHTCTCGTFQKEKDLCKHICWVLMRKFRLPRDHEYCFQPGLVERQILEVLQRPYRTDISAPSAPAQLCSSEEDDGTIRKKDIRDDDICPICQEELLRKRLPVAHCRFGCGNNIHISCMKVWADHQGRSKTDGMVKCPLCREDFCMLKMLLEQVKNAGQLCTSSERERLEKHLGIPCNNCRICPVVGKCFKCSVCTYYHLCEDCFKRNCHPQHSFAVRMKRNQSWQVMMESKKSLTVNQETNTNSETAVMSDVVPEHVLRMFPVIQVHQRSRLLEHGVQCRLCLQSFHVGQQVKTLPCRHKFHSGCIKTWLRQSICCPVDWHVIYNPLTWSGNDIKTTSTALPTSSARVNLTDQQNTELYVPGIGLQKKEISDISKAASLAPVSLEPMVQNTQALCIDSKQFCESRSMQRCSSLEQAPVLASRKRMHAKTSCPSLSLSPAVVRMELSRGTQRSLFVGFNKLDNKAQRKASSLHGQMRPMRLEGDGVGVRTWSSSGDQSILDLQPTSIPISAKHERN